MHNSKMEKREKKGEKSKEEREKKMKRIGGRKRKVKNENIDFVLRVINVAADSRRDGLLEAGKQQVVDVARVHWRCVVVIFSHK